MSLSNILCQVVWPGANCGSRARKLCCLTFELSGRQRQHAWPGLAKMYCVPPDRAWWPAVGAPLERRVRAHRRGAAVDLEFHTLDSGGAAARGQEQSRYSASAEAAVALHGASRLASSSSRSGRGEGVCPLVGNFGHYDNYAAVAAKGGVIVYLDWPASSRP